MEILKPAMAGTLESSDAQVMVEPGEGGIELTLESSVMNQYGRQIKATVLETLDRLGDAALLGDGADVKSLLEVHKLSSLSLPFLTYL